MIFINRYYYRIQYILYSIIFNIVGDSIAVVADQRRWTVENKTSQSSIISTDIVNKNAATVISRNNGNEKSAYMPNYSLRSSSRNWLLGKYINDDIYGGGNFYELIVYDKILTTQEVIQIETYLSSRYNLPIAQYDYSLLSRFLIKQYNNYYIIKSSSYEPIGATYIPIPIQGNNPTAQEVNEYAFEYLSDLFTEITIDDETFKPIDKLFDEFEIKMYKLK